MRPSFVKIIKMVVGHGVGGSFSGKLPSVVKALSFLEAEYFKPSIISGLWGPS